MDQPPLFDDLLSGGPLPPTDDLVVAQRDTEFAALVALREAFNLGLAEFGALTYAETEVIAQQVAPGIFLAQDRKLPAVAETGSAQAYRDLAAALSDRRGIDISPVDLVNSDIDRWRPAAEYAKRPSKSAQRRIARLTAIREELAVPMTESQAISRDVYQASRRVEFVRIVNDPVFEGPGFNEYLLPTGAGLRVRCLHPDPPEWKLGVDVIYEQHDHEDERVRIVVLQYKTWGGKVLYKPKKEEERIEAQINRLQASFCSEDYCASDSEQAFRFPYCTAFLRPTDKFQEEQSRFVTSGLHTPICRVGSLWKPTGKGGHKLIREDLEPVSVNALTFENLFSSQKIGSDWRSYSDVQDLYEKHGLLKAGQTIKLHVQARPNAP